MSAFPAFPYFRRGLRIRYALPALLAALASGPGARGAEAQNADDYFHGSAHKFVAGRLQEATIQVDEGLRKFPNHAPLKGLADHLRKLKEQQNKDQGSQGSSEGDQGGEKQEKKEGEEGGKGQDPGKQEEEKKGQEKDPGKDGKDGKDQEGKDSAQAGESGDKEGRDSTGEAMSPVKPGDMSKEEAERLLNSVQDDEKKEHKQMQRRHRNKVDVEQDW